MILIVVYSILWTLSLMVFSASTTIFACVESSRRMACWSIVSSIVLALSSYGIVRMVIEVGGSK
ncbi:hypothetical protein CN901_09835 [Bacillus cereus]|nr:hypothetical protein COM93_02830 [Bacillus cereus]PET45461.1 hypothetical protein CN521_29750 [Bacillus cereus]PGK22754.1 hypothetical protein CN901_09835 [Bacillus cereus]PGQ24554.1 hypothetical protein COA14_30405 [Bacillus cereus]PGT98634.1 hypothetical protein COD20_24355 [Bacillus cereus]